MAFHTIPLHLVISGVILRHWYKQQVYEFTITFLNTKIGRSNHSDSTEAAAAIEASGSHQHAEGMSPFPSSLRVCNMKCGEIQGNTLDVKRRCSVSEQY